ncbi:putative lipoprotein [Candidatus Paraburkholderia kirkii]|nr:putative lipoprotein [Candidatus Paraburkholderia kirkii]
MRETRNGSYGAKLFFLAQDMLFYVALSQDDRWWSVVKTQDPGRAESIYAQFARKSFDLADGEIRRMQLAAQKALLERVIEKSAERANRLSTNLAFAQQQDSQVSQRQQQLQVDQLQRQTEAGLAPVNVMPSR